LKTYWERVGDQGTLSFTTSLRNESLKSQDEQSSNQNYSVERRSLLSTIQYAYFTTGDRILVTPSVRLHNINDQYNGISRFDNNQRTDASVNTQVGLRFIKNEALTVRTSLGKFVREPAFAELFGSRGLIIGNSNLLPEQGINADLGITYSASSSYRLRLSTNIWACGSTQPFSRVRTSRQIQR